MLNRSDDLAKRSAIEQCAAEPLLFPGVVQPFAGLVAIAPESNTITHISQNCAEIIGLSIDELLGQDARLHLGRDVIHNLRNLQALPSFRSALHHLGTFDIGGKAVDVGAFSSGLYHVLELEPSTREDFGDAEAFEAIQFLLEQIQVADTTQRLFAHTVKLLKHLTGYDRIMIYKFDPDFNGEVLAEERPRKLEPYLGLRFPHWDIAAQAREIMAKLPLRVIQDVDQEPAPLVAAQDHGEPLDITLAASRGVAPVHMEYLWNMGVAATMTLSIKFDDKLWGMMSFHDRRPRVPPAKLRQVLTSFIGVFAIKLKSLEEQAVLANIAQIDAAKTEILAELEGDQLIADPLERIGPVLAEAVSASGAATLQGSQTAVYGQAPGQAIMARIIAAAQDQPGQVLKFENLSKTFPDAADGLNGCAGALVMSPSAGKAFCVFRPEIAQTIKWAGNPEKTVEPFESEARLAPRASFSRYLEEIAGQSAHWSEQDIRFMSRIWPVMNAVERNKLLQKAGRTQQIMIDELNHRVRNILALVRSVSRQSRRRYSSLESYAAALESRIQALAASHEISTGVSIPSVSVAHLINREMAPFMKKNAVSVTGADPHIRSEVAPIFSLVIHELTTNAVKYGALSSENGTVAIDVSPVSNGFEVRWKEEGGPEVLEPNERGFGSPLIENAVPHELNGHAELLFEPTGVSAILSLPAEAIDANPSPTSLNPKRTDPLRPTAPRPLPGDPPEGVVLVVEDNFIIAQEMLDQLVDFGFEHVNTVATLGDALVFLETETPTFAILDVNLGVGETSLPIAERLKELGVPLVFATGYGESAQIDPQLEGAPRLLKPVTANELQAALSRLLQPQGGTS